MTAAQTRGTSGSDLAHFDVDIRPTVARVLDDHPTLPRPGADYPAWVTGCLGDRLADVWFIAENPSVSTAQRAIAGATVDDQWNTSDGDKLFRETLITYAFKAGVHESASDWRCYLIDVIKSAYVVKDWNAKRPTERRSIAEQWAPVLDREIALGKPRLIVTVGGRAQRLLEHVMRAGLLPNLSPQVFDAREKVQHYSYLMNYPEGKVPARHPDRIAAWQRRFADIARHREIAASGRPAEPAAITTSFSRRAARAA